MEEQELKRMISAGMSQNDIALALGKSQTNVRYWLKKFGLRTETRKLLKYKIRDEQLLFAASNAESYSDLLYLIDARHSGGAFYHYKKRLLLLGFDFSRWTFQGKSGGGKKMGIVRNRLAIQQRRRLPRRVLDKFLRDSNIQEECNHCKLKNWHGAKLALHIHHINNNPKDNSLANLEYLCPNCHSVKHTNVRLLIS